MSKKPVKKAPKAKKKKDAKEPSLFQYGLYALAVAAFMTLVFHSCGFIGMGETIRPKTTSEMSQTSVKIVRNDRRSGGTGVILKSTPSESTILTNGHVCGVVENGGLVITDDAEHSVTSYKKSEAHDLCLITVAANLHVNTVIADSAPRTYSDAAASGHPGLLPNVVTRGHFSGREIIEVMTGLRECEDKDYKDNGLLCILLGGIPQIKRYESQVVTATIKPGSSGSAVFNEDGEISALVFAGSGDIGYAYTVPYEAIANFVNKERFTLESKRPSDGYEITLKSLMKSILGSSAAEVKTTDERIVETCSVERDPKVTQLCKVMLGDMVWRN